FAHDVTLTAYNAKGGSTLNPSSGKLGYLSNFVVTTPATLVATAFAKGVGGAPSTSPVNTTTISYELPNAFSNSAPHGTWTAPTDVFVRASNVETGPSSSSMTVTSLRSVAANSIEGGVRVVLGRLRVNNTYGSELLPMPVTLNAQFYAGSTTG